MSFITFLINYLLPFILICYLLLKQRFNYWKSRGVPSTSPNTLMGDLIDIGRKYHISQKLQILYDQFKAAGKGYGGLFSITNPVFMVTDLGLVKQILIKDFNFFTDRAFYNNEKDDPLSVNLLTLEGERWRRRRNLLTPIFTSGKLKHMFDIILHKRDELYRVADESVVSGVPVDTKILARNFTLASIGTCAFGIDLETGSEGIMKLKKLVLGGSNPFGIVKFLITTNFPNFGRFFRMRFTDKNVADFVLDMVANNVKYREESGYRRGDLLDLLMDIKKEHKISDLEEFDFIRLAAESLLFFVGGFETR